MLDFSSKQNIIWHASFHNALFRGAVRNQLPLLWRKQMMLRKAIMQLVESISTSWLLPVMKYPVLSWEKEKIVTSFVNELKYFPVYESGLILLSVIKLVNVSALWKGKKQMLSAKKTSDNINNVIANIQAWVLCVRKHFFL